MGLDAPPLASPARVNLRVMSAEHQDDPNAPVWGADGWPRQLESGLDEADELLIRSHLAMTPAERLRALENFVNGVEAIRRGRIPPR